MFRVLFTQLIFERSNSLSTIELSAEPPSDLPYPYQHYVARKFGEEGLKALYDTFTVLREHAERGQQVVEDSESNSEQLRAAMVELKLKNNWKVLQKERLTAAMK